MCTHKYRLDERSYREHTTYLHVKEYRKDIPIMPPDPAPCFTLISSNYLYLEHIFMVPKVFEPLKVCIFKCILGLCKTFQSTGSDWPSINVSKSTLSHQSDDLPLFIFLRLFKEWISCFWSLSKCKLYWVAKPSEWARNEPLPDSCKLC